MAHPFFFGDFSGDHRTARCRQPAEGTSRSGLNRRGSVDLGVVDSVGKLLHRLVYVVFCAHSFLSCFRKYLCNMSVLDRTCVIENKRKIDVDSCR